jgi:hypothetical protein
MMEKMSAEADLKIRLDAIRNVEANSQASIDAAIARNILHEDLGYFTNVRTAYTDRAATFSRTR